MLFDLGEEGLNVVLCFNFLEWCYFIKLENLIKFVIIFLELGPRFVISISANNYRVLYSANTP